MRQVVLAGPDDLRRRADGLGGLDGVDDEVHLGSSPEPSAEERRVDGDPLPRQTGEPRRGLLRISRVLGRCPDLAGVGPHVRGRVHRLHARVLEEGDLVYRLEGPAMGDRQDRLGVAVLPHHPARLGAERRVVSQDLCAADLSQRPLVPRDLENLPTVQGGPE